MCAQHDLTYANILRRAAELVGGLDELCRLLEVPKDAVEAWVTGESVPPQAVLLRAVNVLLDHLAGKSSN